MTLKNHFKNYFRGLFLPLLSILVFVPFITYGLMIYIILALFSPFYFPLSSFFYRHSLTISLSIDQLANASIHGNEDQTISGRLGYAIYYLKQERKIFVIICKILNKFFSQKNHCKDAIEFDRL